MSRLGGMITQRRRYFTPTSLFRNIRLNVRHNRGFDRRRILLVSPSADLDIEKSARICLEPNAKLNFGFIPHDFVTAAPARLQMRENSRLIVRGNCTVTTGVVVFVAPNTTVTLGKNLHVISNCRILAHADIEIGDDCIVGWEAQIMSGDGHPAFRNGEVLNPPRPIRIGDHVWIGARATILKGVTVSSGAVIGADAVVTKDVPKNATVAGNPARVVATDISWSL